MPIHRKSLAVRARGKRRANATRAFLHYFAHKKHLCPTLM